VRKISDECKRVVQCAKLRKINKYSGDRKIEEDPLHLVLYFSTEYHNSIQNIIILITNINVVDIRE